MASASSARDDASSHCGRRPWRCCEKLCACNRVDHRPCPHRRSSGQRRLHSYTALTITNRLFRGFTFARRRRFRYCTDSVCDSLTGIRAARKSSRLEVAQQLLKRSSLPGSAMFTHAAVCARKGRSTPRLPNEPSPSSQPCRRCGGCRAASRLLRLILSAYGVRQTALTLRWFDCRCHFSSLQLTGGSLKTTSLQPYNIASNRLQQVACAGRRPAAQLDPAVCVLVPDPHSGDDKGLLLSVIAKK